MKYEQIVWPELSVEVRLSVYLSSGSTPEYHAVFQLTDIGWRADEQYQRIDAAICLLQERLQATLVWKRFFVSDAVNQKQWFDHPQGNVAVSIVQQPPLNGAKVVVWGYLLSDVRLSKDTQGATIVQHGEYRHLYHTQLYASGADEALQTTAIFRQYVEQLAAHRCSLSDNCIRTWIYVQGVDTHYKGMVKARRACFERENLTPETHYIASTGIEGKYIDPAALVFMDAYAIQGLHPGQIQYLYAPTHLNPTHEYGVTFERGTVVHYGDRRHVFISGTASINNRGEVEYPLDIRKQTERMFENIGVLLTEADCSMDDVMHLIVYLRDTADYQTVNAYLKQTYPDIPTVILWAPVCRTGWLVEAECMAIKSITNKQFADY